MGSETSAQLRNSSFRQNRANLLQVGFDLSKPFDGWRTSDGLVGSTPGIRQAGKPIHTCSQLGGRKYLHDIDGNNQPFDVTLLMRSKIPVVTPAADSYLTVVPGGHPDQPMAGKMKPISLG